MTRRRTAHKRPMSAEAQTALVLLSAGTIILLSIIALAA